MGRIGLGEFNIGKVKEGSRNTAIFALVSKGIKRVKTFCGCTSYTRETDSKGDTVLKVIYKAQEIPKHLQNLPVSKKVIVYYESGNFEELHIKGIVIK